MDYNTPYKVLSNERYNNTLTLGNDLITFFTPTYNRARFLPRIADCLRNQTNKDFVWIVVNDGAIDNTEIVMNELLLSEELPIKYISKQNGGKHSAFKCGLDECETTYFQCMDDDDLYDENAVDFFLCKWKEIKLKHLANIGAIRTLSRRPDGTYKTNFAITEADCGREYIASTLENNYINNRLQENWTCYETKKLRNIDLFPTDYWMFDQHNFFSEGLWQGRFARKYNCLYVNIALREYHEDDSISLMRQPKSKQFFIDRFINSKMALDEQYDYISIHKTNLIKQCLIFNWIRAFLGISLSDVLHHTYNRELRIWYLLVYPTSFLNKLYVNNRC